MGILLVEFSKANLMELYVGMCQIGSTLLSSKSPHGGIVVPGAKREGGLATTQLRAAQQQCSSDACVAADPVPSPTRCLLVAAGGGALPPT